MLIIKSYQNILNVLFIILIILFASGAANKTFIEVRNIKPPKLGKKYYGKHITCIRPMRKGSPRMEIEELNGKIIAHNYGHGGSGWTLAPGATNYIIDKLDLKLKQANITKSESITIIGAGVMGLFSAYELIKRGYNNITIVAQSYSELTSHNAGGLIAPVSMDNTPQVQALINEIGVESYNFFKKVAKGKNKTIKKGSSIIPAYFETRQESGLEAYVKKNMMKKSRDVVLDFGNGTRRVMVEYSDALFVDVGIWEDLRSYLIQRNVAFKTDTVKNIADIKSKVVINCSGLGAKDLVKDNKMVPVQGHLVMLKDQNPQDLQYMILTYGKTTTTKAGFKVKRSFYIFPKRLPGSKHRDVGVIGGTFIHGADKNTPNFEEFGIMKTNARRFYGL